MKKEGKRMMKNKEYIKLKKFGKPINLFFLTVFASLTMLAVLYWMINLNRILAELAVTKEAWHLSPDLLKPLLAHFSG